MKIINYFNNTPKRDFIDCRITGLRDYLHYFDLNLDSYDIFVLGQTIDCSLLKFKLKKESPLQLCLLGASNLELEQYVFHSLGIHYEKKRFSQNMREDIRCSIDQDKPIIARVDIRYLFQPDFIPKKFDIHCVSSTIICGYDFAGEDCVYIELKERHNSPLRKVRFKDFEKAVNSITFPLEVNRMYFEPSLDKSLIYNLNSHKKEYLWRALKSLCECMLNGDVVTLENSYEYKNIEGGLGVLKKVIGLNHELEDELRNVNNEVKHRIFMMYFLTMRDMMTPGSNYCYRKEFGETLWNLAKKLDEKAFEKIGNEFKLITREWRELTRILSKPNVCDNDKKKKNYFKKVNDQLSFLYAREQRQFQNIYHLTMEKYECMGL